MVYISSLILLFRHNHSLELEPCQVCRILQDQIDKCNRKGKSCFFIKVRTQVIKLKLDPGIPPDEHVSVSDLFEIETVPDSGIFSDLSNDVSSPPSGELKFNN